MKVCGSAGRQCPREATLTARITGVGDRNLCRECFDAYVVLMGEDCRPLEANAFIPAWKQRGLARDFTRAFGR